MLIDFKVSNFLSFETLQTFSMQAGKVRNFSERIYTSKKEKLLKFMAIYGANASGKSNLVEALKFAKETIMNGLPSNALNYYCRLKDDNKTKETIFEFTLNLDGKRYSYGFAVQLNTASFTREWLFEQTYTNKYKIIFERNIEEGCANVDQYFKDNALNERLKIYVEDILHDDSILFLSLMNTNKDSLYNTNENIKIYKTIYMWFKYKLSVNSPDSPITNFSFLLDNASIAEISNMLSDFSTGVSQFKITDISLDKVSNSISKELMSDITEHLLEQKKYLEENSNNATPAVMLRNPLEKLIFILELNKEGQISAKTLQFNHQNTDAVFLLNEESDGTIRLLDLIEILLTGEKDQVYVVDEINRRFHPLLTYKFVEKYLELAKERDIQLIVTTHESKIMDFALLRKDEINFINKNEQGSSAIYSLEKFGERFDKKIGTAYLKGDYGAIPTFK